MGRGFGGKKIEAPGFSSLDHWSGNAANSPSEESKGAHQESGGAYVRWKMTGNARVLEAPRRSILQEGTQWGDASHITLAVWTKRNRSFDCDCSTGAYFAIGYGYKYAIGMVDTQSQSEITLETRLTHTIAHTITIMFAESQISDLQLQKKQILPGLLVRGLLYGFAATKKQSILSHLFSRFVRGSCSGF